MFILAPILTFAALAAAHGQLITRDARYDINRWSKKCAAPRLSSIKIHVALRQEDAGRAIESHLAAISDPKNSRFRQYLSVEELADLSRPITESFGTVTEWLREHGLMAVTSASGDILEIDTTISRVQSMLNTTYHVFTDGSQDIIRTESISLPAHIAEHIDFITPTTIFPKPKPHASLRRHVSRIKAASLERRDTCNSGDQVTPTCVREIYHIGNYTAQPNRTTFAVYGTEGATFKASDLQSYLSNHNPPAAQASATYQIIGNGAANESSGIEAQFETALDTQTLLGIAYPIPAILYRKGGVFGPKAGQIYDPFVQFLTDLTTNSTSTLPSVISFSESNPEDTFDPTYARRLCNLMARVSARGITLVFSSGDNGPQGDTSSGTHSAIFEPEFPASCPYVLAVGGTTDLAAETAATQSTLDTFTKLYYTASGGGFSNVFSQPPWQREAVGRYVSTQIPASYASLSGFNASGRGIPDVAAFSSNFPVVVDDITIGIGGTSASTPTWAAVIALLNDYEIGQGRPTVGLVGPWLYSLGCRNGSLATPALKDITTGGNNVGQCSFLGGCRLSQTAGFNVSVGWDPVTGLGSPLFDGLTAALDQSAAHGFGHWKKPYEWHN